MSFNSCFGHRTQVCILDDQVPAAEVAAAKVGATLQVIRPGKIKINIYQNQTGNKIVIHTAKKKQ